MVNLKKNLMMEIEKLNKMMENNDYIINDFTLEQSIKVDKLDISYTELKLVIINEKLENLMKKVAI